MTASHVPKQMGYQVHKITNLQSLECIPEGWALTTIETICDKPQYGWTTSAHNFGTIRLLRTTDITSSNINWQTVPFCKEIPEDINRYLLQKNDIVISRAGSVGFSYLLDDVENTVFASYLIRFRPLIDSKFFYYFLQSPFYWKSIFEKRIGIAIPNVNATKLKHIVFCLPPLAEQKRIVAKIESIFSRIDVIRERLETLAVRTKSSSENSNALKNSILKQAFEGRLVTQDLGEEPAKVLLKKICKDYKKEPPRKKDVLPKNWEIVSLSTLAKINPPKPPRGEISDNTLVSFVPMRSVEELSGRINLNKTRKYGEVRKSYTFFQNNDILFAKITPCMENGKIAMAYNLENNIGFGSTEFHVIRLKNNVLPKFYFYYMIRDDFRNNAQYKMRGTAGQLRVPLNYIKNALVPIPPLAEQKRIVAKIESIFDRIDVNVLYENHVTRSFMFSSIQRGLFFLITLMAFLVENALGEVSRL